MIVAKLSAAKLEQALEKQDAVLSSLCDDFIACGRGHERHSDIVAQSDALSLRYADASAARRVLQAEKDRRMSWHGSLKPIKQAA